MRKILIVLALLVLFSQKIQTIQAQVIEIHPPISSASRDSIVLQDKREMQKNTIKRVLEKHNSPMVNSVDTFMRVADEYNLNPYLLPAIAGTESTFGNAIMAGSYNPFGWGGGTLVFKNWDDAIETVGRGLRANYVDRGADTLAGVGAIYAASPAWPTKVKYFLGQFETEEKTAPLSADNQLFFDLNAVK